MKFEPVIEVKFKVPPILKPLSRSRTIWAVIIGALPAIWNALLVDVLPTVVDLNDALGSNPVLPASVVRAFAIASGIAVLILRVQDKAKARREAKP